VIAPNSLFPAELTFASQCVAALRDAKLAAASAGGSFGWAEIERVIGEQFEAWDRDHFRGITEKVSERRGAKGKDPCFEAMAQLCGIDWRNCTADERGRLNNALKQLRAVTPSLSPEHLSNFASRWKAKYPSAELTAKTFSANWSLVSHTKTSKEAKIDHIEELSAQLARVRAEKNQLYPEDAQREDLNEPQLVRLRWLVAEESNLSSKLARIRGYG